MQLVGPNGSLPQGVELTVSFGGASKESYVLGVGGQDNKTLCCQAGRAVLGPLPPVSCDFSSKALALRTDAATTCAPDARAPQDNFVDAAALVDAGGTNSSPPVPASAIQCELWTGGAAEITVRAAGYERIEETLTAVPREEKEFENCPALKTLDVRLVLSRGDAGLP